MPRINDRKLLILSQQIRSPIVHQTPDHNTKNLRPTLSLAEWVMVQGIPLYAMAMLLMLAAVLILPLMLLAGLGAELLVHLRHYYVRRAQPIVTRTTKGWPLCNAIAKMRTL